MVKIGFRVYILTKLCLQHFVESLYACGEGERKSANLSCVLLYCAWSMF